MRSTIITAFAFAALTGAACSSGGANFFGAGPPTSMVAFPKSKESTESFQALGRGTLVLRDGCLRKVDGEDSRLIIWPASASPTPARDGAIDGQSGRRVVAGDLITVPGGEVDSIDPTAFDPPIPATCVGPYWMAGPGFAKAG